MPTARVVIAVDGRTKVDCPHDGDTAITDIAVLAVDGMLCFRGSHHGNNIDAFVLLGDQKLINHDWLDRFSAK